LPVSKIKKKAWLALFLKEDMSAPFALIDKGDKVRVLVDDYLLPTANIIIRKKYFKSIGFFNKAFASNFGFFKVFGGYSRLGIIYFKTMYFVKNCQFNPVLKETPSKITLFKLMRKYVVINS